MKEHDFDQTFYFGSKKKISDLLTNGYSLTKFFKELDGCDQTIFESFIEKTLELTYEPSSEFCIKKDFYRDSIFDYYNNEMYRDISRNKLNNMWDYNNYRCHGLSSSSSSPSPPSKTITRKMARDAQNEDSKYSLSTLLAVGKDMFENIYDANLYYLDYIVHYSKDSDTCLVTKFRVTASV